MSKSDRGNKLNAEETEQAPTGLRDLGRTYVNAFVTFMDVLGFKEIVSSSDPAQINTLLDAMQVFAAKSQKRRPPYDQTVNLPIVVQFSDSIIRIQPLSESDEEVDALDLFHSEITSLLLSQGNLACNGILVRGGLTFGQICVHDDRIFGPAFNRAYLIESKLANYPRIVIDEFLCSASMENPIVQRSGVDKWREIAWHLFEYLDRADDGQWGIHYLANMFDAERPSGVSGEDVLVSHRDAIKRLLSAALSKRADDVLTKIRWAASYHNRTIEKSFRRIKERYEDSNNSLIVDLDGTA